MKATFQILKACGHTCPCGTQTEVNSIRPMLPTQFNVARAKKPNEKPEETKPSGKIKPLMPITKKY